jgi:uncharacterized protein YqgC (DUF456 family)
MSIVLWIVGVLLVIVGIAGIIFPALPGHVLIFAGLLLAAWADNFTRVSGWSLALIGVIAAFSYTVDFAAAAVVGAGLGTLLGIPFGLPGVLLGPLAGAVLGELTVHRQWRRAAGVGVAAWIGFLIGTAVKVGLAFAMIAIFIAALFWL